MVVARRGAGGGGGEEMKARALPFITFEHKRFVPASPSRAHLGDALVGLRCFGGFFFFSRGVPARDLRSCVSEIFWDFAGISIRGEILGGRIWAM